MTFCYICDIFVTFSDILWQFCTRRLLLHADPRPLLAVQHPLRPGRAAQVVEQQGDARLQVTLRCATHMRCRTVPVPHVLVHLRPGQPRPHVDAEDPSEVARRPRVHRVRDAANWWVFSRGEPSSCRWLMRCLKQEKLYFLFLDASSTAYDAS